MPAQSLEIPRWQREIRPDRGYDVYLSEFQRRQLSRRVPISQPIAIVANVRTKLWRCARIGCAKPRLEPAEITRSTARFAAPIDRLTQQCPSTGVRICDRSPARRE
jgi:hypothetical protein